MFIYSIKTKYLTSLSILTLIVLLVVTPFVGIAQTINFYQDGSAETTSTRRERIRNYRIESSENQQKIDALGTVAAVSIPIPILFGVGLGNIYPNFGDPRVGGRIHEGEDIMAVNGTPIVSPTPAVVIRTGTGETEGLYVYTANPGGEIFVYMHLDRIGEGVTPGTVLTQGGLIGYVGNTGNASGGAAHLHFEIHDSTDTPINPFPRLATEFSLQEKISYLSTILTQTSNATALSEFLVSNFRSTFVSAVAGSIPLPQSITNAILTVPVSSGGRVVLPDGDLDVGSKGTAVVALQKYIIASSKGPARDQLALVGATGTFGMLTKAALIEYQIAKNISPANGYYGATTRAFIVASPLGTLQGPNTPAVFTRTLYMGVLGEDVRTLQKLLNSKGYTVALQGGGSVGNETTYFGPATQSAVVRFQVAYKISPAVGTFGPTTRATLLSL